MEFLTRLFAQTVQLSILGGIVILMLMPVRMLLRKAPKAFSYILWGIVLIRPQIYLPGNLALREQAYIILHEQYHIRRMDHWAKALFFGAMVIHWFNPLVWLAYRLFVRDMEMSCDEAVIRRAGEGIRAEYAAILAHHAGKYLDGDCRTVHIKELAYEETGKSIETVTLYGIVLYQEFKLTEGILEDVSGACIPTVLSFVREPDGSLTLREYWEPRDGTYYPEDLREKFAGKPWPDVQNYRVEQQMSLYAQAMEHFGVGTDVVIHTLLQDITDRNRWHDGIAELMEGCSTQRELLAAYGADTLKFCFETFTAGGQDDLYGQIMAFVCSEIMEQFGEPPLQDWSFQQSGQDWFRAIKDRARELVEHGVDLRISYPGTYLLISMDESILHHPDWGLTITGENVTPSGMTLVVTQSGINPDGELITGQPYFLDRLEDGEWIPLEPLLEAWSWTMEAWLIPVNGTTRWDVNWEWLYGTLEAGQYRFGKNISCLSEPGMYEEAVYYVEFPIN